MTCVCEGCGAKAETDCDPPKGWGQTILLQRSVRLCGSCWQAVSSDELWSASNIVFQELLATPRDCVAQPDVGDEVLLLVDGIRGKFKGRRGLVTNVDGSTCGIRVPGAVASGETGEYVGPYHRCQFRLLRGSSTFRDTLDDERKEGSV